MKLPWSRHGEEAPEAPHEASLSPSDPPSSLGEERPSEGAGEGAHPSTAEEAPSSPPAPPEGSSPQWSLLKEEARRETQRDAATARYLSNYVLSHETFSSALSYLLANRLQDDALSRKTLTPLLQETLREHPEVLDTALEDLDAHLARDAAATSLLATYLFSKGFHALQTHRIASLLWQEGRTFAALMLRGRGSEVFGVDIHPAARLGRGLMLDHATGIVIGETAVVGDGVSFLHGVTLGGTGKETGDRHPKVGAGVLLGAGATLLGNITVGENAKVGAGSVVLQDVAPSTTVAGVPAKVVAPCEGCPATTLDQGF